MTTVARWIGRRLWEAGIHHAFGLPGGEVVELIEGLRQEGVEFIVTRHEAAAAFMANAYGQATGRPGVCIATLGPGATNLVTGVAHAYLDRAPVIAITAQLPDAKYTIATHQAVDLMALYRPITKWQARVDPGNVKAVVERALRVATEERPGPVYLMLPSSHAAAEVDDRPYPAAEVPAPGGPVAPVAPGAIRAAAERVERARRPVLLVGLSAARAGASAQMLALAERLGAPVIVGPKAKGSFPEDHPLFAGTIEMLGTDVLFDLIASSDRVIAAGFDPVELDRDWTFDAPVLNVDTVPADPYYPVDFDLTGPLVPTLAALAEAVRPGARWAPEEVAEVRRRLRARIDVEVPGLSPQQAIRALQAAFPRDTLIAVDVGAHKMATGQVWQSTVPGTFYMSNGLSSMGYAFPAALALKLVHRERKVVAVVGDGAFAMSMAELETAVRVGLGVTAVVLVDGALSLIEMAQERRGYPSTGTRFGNPDFAAVARAFGVEARTVRTPEEAEAAFAEAARADGPFLVAVHVNPAGYRLG